MRVCRNTRDNGLLFIGRLTACKVTRILNQAQRGIRWETSVLLFTVLPHTFFGNATSLQYGAVKLAKLKAAAADSAFFVSLAEIICEQRVTLQLSATDSH